MKKILTLLPGLFAMAGAVAAETPDSTPPLSEKSVIVVHRAAPVPVERVVLENWALEARFPQPPEPHAAEEMSPFGAAKRESLTLVDGQTIYAISRLSLPTAIQAGQVEAMFEATRDELLRKGWGSLKLEENVTVAGLPGRRYMMEFTREPHVEDYRSDYRLVLVDGSIYVLLFRQPRNYYSSADARAFFDAVKRKTPDPSRHAAR